jgi:transposase
MSKTISHHFSGTSGHKAFYGNALSGFIVSRKNADDIISERVKGLDTTEHPILRKKYLSQSQMTKIKEKIANRSATMKEYKNYEMTKRLNDRRKQAVDRFWRQERKRLLQSLPTTRSWTTEQRQDILAGRKPKYHGRTIQGHHTYSVNKYPHLANRHEVIYPATFEEHLYGWHGGNFKNSKPGEMIRHITSF